MSGGGIDAYVRVAFAGEKPVETRKVSTRGSDVDFQQVCQAVGSILAHASLYFTGAVVSRALAVHVEPHCHQCLGLGPCRR